ncbi:unnamed protein product [Malassezia sympodialis ATCC 42132]|uniref:uncharacterized protein n=1 Tax=Malassezia sympodialis (strain ATCC 42132) TaxID=1230383 RepID=UPI0002C1B2B7|nr:uncharacterized protein MSY001_2696 [Malassezia sympodialis ATCC 42132]CCU99991.1 unnamed protein product [Malassezia sympodialis ATCC 42132]|eukprot:XP_018741206.1 uncharacterized protein MSY001_2696 [Malassezia sympodialis ATCC 42132]
MKGARSRRGQAAPVAPAPKMHQTFEDDEESEVDIPIAPEADDPEGEESSSETDSDSEVEELTIDKTARSAAAQARQRAQPAKLSRRARQQRAQLDESTPEEQDEEEEAVPDRLDPALFAAAFAHTGDAAAREVLRGERATAPPAARRAAPARGLDGRPMTRLRGERTIVRTLDDADAPSLSDDADAPLSYEALGVQRPRAAARERAYKKRKLGLRAKDAPPPTLPEGGYHESDSTKSE